MNLTQVDFLDVSLNIQTEKFWPFKKQNSKTICINKHSNHLYYIKYENPRMVNKRLCEISCNEEEFKKLKILMRKHYIKVDSKTNKPKKTNRNRKNKAITMMHGKSPRSDVQM